MSGALSPVERMPESARYPSVVTPSGTPCSSVPAEVVLAGTPHEVEGMTVYPLDEQRVQGKISVDPDRLGLVADGLDGYLEDRRVESRSIPTTYSSWDDELPDSTYGRRDVPVVDGPIGTRSDGDGALQLCFRSEHVRAGVRILTGGGRFDGDSFALHLAVPFAVLTHENGAVALSPIFRPVDSAPSDPAFTYEDADAGEEFTVDT